MSGLVIGLVSFCQNQTKNLILLFLFPYKVIQSVFKELKSRDLPPRDDLTGAPVYIIGLPVQLYSSLFIFNKRNWPQKNNQTDPKSIYLTFNDNGCYQTFLQ